MKICGACGLLIGDELSHRNWHGQLASLGITSFSSGANYLPACPLDGNWVREWRDGQDGWACGHRVPMVVNP